MDLGLEDVARFEVRVVQYLGLGVGRDQRDIVSDRNVDPFLGRLGQEDIAESEDQVGIVAEELDRQRHVVLLHEVLAVDGPAEIDPELGLDCA